MSTTTTTNKLPDESDVTTAPMSPFSIKKKPHLCCGCFCDCRRAVIVINIINICFLCIFGSFLLFGASFFKYFAEQESVDDFQKKQAEQLSEYYRQFPIGIFFLLAIPQLCLHAFGVVGALQYKRSFVIASLVAYGIQIGLSILGPNYISLIFAILFSYPHVILINEMEDGTMTPETYATPVNSNNPPTTRCIV